MGIINSSFLSVSTFLQQHIYHVPEYQRGYSWTEDQLEDMWIDLIQLEEDNNLSSHFLGQIVVHYDVPEDRYYIIDGQQRTSTSIVLLDVIRTHLDNLAETSSIEDAKIDADDITTKYIGRVTSRRQDQRLYLGDIDRTFFEKQIQVREKEPIVNTKKLKNSEKLILEARNYFDNKISEYLSDFEDNEVKYTEINTLLKTLIDGFKVMYLETDDINEAFVIFETLNARGKDLETSDLLKNHVFRSASNKIEIIKDDWNQILENLGNIDPTKFIRHYWNSKYKFVREKDLYKSMRNQINTPKRVEKLIEDLLNLSELYTSLNSPVNNVYYQNDTLIERMKEIKKLNAKSFYPIMLSLESENFSEENINDILKSIECLIVRNFVVAGKVANRYEIEFSKIALQISEHNLTDVTSIIESIKNLTINDEEFLDDFKIFTTKKTSVVRYLLRKIHNSQDKETRIINNNNTIHVEHIMPKKPAMWDVEEEIHKEYLWRLGNLTLLGQEYNRSATNKTFDKKKEVYNNSNIKMTKKLTSYDQWTIKDIEKRQEEFAYLAIEIWKK